MHLRHLMNGTVARLLLHDSGDSTLPGLKQGGYIPVEQLRVCQIEGVDILEFLLALIIPRIKLNSDQVAMVMDNGASDSEHRFVTCEQKFYIAYLSGAHANMKQPRFEQSAGTGNINQLAAVGHELQAQFAS